VKALRALGALGALRSVSALGALSALGAFGVLACDDDIVAPERGSLAVTITGLPPGQSGEVTVTGPGGFSRALTVTTTLDDLLPGSYGITATPVVQGSENRWAPTPSDQTVVIPAGAGTTSATVTYAIASARLAVTVSGLPNGVNANVTVAGPGYNNVLTSSTAINLLTPGAYTITAANVVAGGVTYTAAPSTQTIQLPASTTQVAATVVYSVGTGSLTVTINGLAGVNGSVLVTGPSGYSQQLTATETLTPVPPGAYTITASPVASNLTTHTPTPQTQNVTVTAGATASGTVTYAGSSLVLGVQEMWPGTDLGDVVYLTSPPGDARIFVVDQAGRIFVIKNGARLTTPFLDITNIVAYGGEQGLLSMAFDPQFATNGRFYVYHNDLNGDIAVARYTATGDVANAGSRTPVINIPHPTNANHNGGLAMFGPDGMLYLGTGDGGSANDPPDNAQNLNVLLGKLLRIDVTNLPYTIPAGNPYAGATTGRDEIWAHGLRNPWRYAFDPPAGTLYIADVGQGSWEEVNAVPATTAGLNYGWRLMEGNHCHIPSTCNPVGLTVPVFEYSHAGGNCSVTGGFVYRGTAIPELVGHYLFADFCAGILRSFRLAGVQAADERTWAIGDVNRIKSFGLDASGEIYILSDNRNVYRVVKQ
jgi:glucose/arabinose dehydrogenase